LVRGTRIALIGNDQRVYQLCCEILATHSGRHQLIVAEPRPPFPEAEIYIWDYHPGLELAWQKVAAEPSSHLVLVERGELAESRNAKLEAAMLALKPVTQAVLAAWLEKTLEDRAAGTAGLRRDRDELLQTLMETSLRLQEYDQDRTNFLAKAVHDFRAPLTASSGYCGLLLDGQLGPLTSAQEKVLTRVQASLKRLSRMTAAMFQLSVGQRVQRPPNLERGDIRESVEQALHEIEPLAAERRVKVRVVMTSPNQDMYFEREQLVQVALNLLDNAAKFAPKAGQVEIRGYPCFWDRRSPRVQKSPEMERRSSDRATPNAYRVDVHNTGPGIPEERLERIFEEYATYGSGQSFGSGLGLAISKVIVQRHGGRIWAENDEGGPTLSFIIPFAPEGSAVSDENKETAAYQVRSAGK
jgi:signal transduction histidine kinase